MKALRVTRLVDRATVRSIDAHGDPPVLHLEGVGFTHAVGVRLNGKIFGGFVLHDDTVLEITVPLELRSAPIQSVDVICGDLSPGGDVSLEWAVGPDVVSGVHKLVQRWVKLLLTTPGTDSFHPDHGGGLRSVLGAVVDPDEPGPLVACILAAVTRTTDQTVASQNTRRLPPDERLRRVDVLDLSFDRKRLAFDLRLGFETASGKKMAIGVAT